MPNPALPPRHTLPRDVTVPVLPGLGLTWYDRGAKYWRRRVRASLVWLVLTGLILLIDVGLYRSIRHSSHAAFAVLIVIDVALTIATLVFFAVRTAQRWNSPGLPGRPGIPAPGKGQGPLAAALLQIGWVLGSLIVAVVYLFCPALFVALFLISLMPQTLAERRARLWVAERLHERGATV
jgi:hypothetical protein